LFSLFSSEDIIRLISKTTSMQAIRREIIPGKFSIYIRLIFQNINLQKII